MKSTELQIGDWVYYDRSYPVLYPVKVETIALGEINRTVDTSFSPIPLTSEILEKNGFERFGTDYILKGRRFGLSNPSTPNNYKDNYWLKVSTRAVKIKYVHELQHALQLCGIEKEIIL